MSRFTTDDYDTDHSLPRPGQLSSNGHWVFGSVYAVLALIGFSFGVWAGASKPKPPKVADAKPKDTAPKPSDQANPTPVTPPANPTPPVTDQKPEAPEAKSKDTDPKPPEPDPTPPAEKPGAALATLGTGLGPLTTTPPPPPVKAVAFKEVMPILRAYCADCHGGSTGKPKGGVDVTTIAKMMKSKGPPLVVGKPNESSLYLSIKNGDMPPDGKKGPDEKELQLIHDWIAGGAKPRRAIRPRGARLRSRHRVELTAPAESG